MAMYRQWSPFGVNAMGAGAESVPPILYDTFTGTGALTSHAPDICPVGSSWGGANAWRFANLSGGFLTSGALLNGAATIDVGVHNHELDVMMSATMGATGQDMAGFNCGTTVSWYIRSYNSVLNAAATLIPWPETFVADKLYKIHVSTYGDQHVIWIDDAFVEKIDKAGTLTTVSVLYSYIGGAWDYIKVSAVQPWVRVATLGDSRVSSWLWNQTYDGVEKQYNNARFYRMDHATAGGSVIHDLATQVAAAASDAADLVVIAMGVNDAFQCFGLGDSTHSVANCQPVYEDAIDALKLSNPTATIVCMGIYATTNNYHIEDYNAMFQAVAAAKGVTFWDASTWVTDPATQLSDGIHPTAAYYPTIQAYVLALFRTWRNL